MTQGFNSSGQLGDPPSRHRVQPLSRALLAFGALFLGSCNLPPCLEGRFRVELGERIPDSNCAFAEWPGGVSFTFETAGFVEESYDCDTERGRYLELPDASRRTERGGIAGGGRPKTNTGWEAVSFEKLTFELDDCTLDSKATLRFDGAFQSVDEALGKKEGFFVDVTYNGGEACRHLFGPDGDGYACFNAHPATVTRL